MDQLGHWHRRSKIKPIVKLTITGGLQPSSNRNLTRASAGLTKQIFSLNKAFSGLNKALFSLSGAFAGLNKALFSLTKAMFGPKKGADRCNLHPFIGYDFQQSCQTPIRMNRQRVEAEE